MRLAATVAAWMVVAFLGADKLGMAAAEDAPAQQVTQQTSAPTSGS